METMMFYSAIAYAVIFFVSFTWILIHILAFFMHTERKMPDITATSLFLCLTASILQIAKTICIFVAEWFIVPIAVLTMYLDTFITLTNAILIVLMIVCKMDRICDKLKIVDKIENGIYIFYLLWVLCMIAVLMSVEISFENINSLNSDSNVTLTKLPLTHWSWKSYRAIILYADLIPSTIIFSMALYVYDHEKKEELDALFKKCAFYYFFLLLCYGPAFYQTLPYSHYSALSLPLFIGEIIESTRLLFAPSLIVSLACDNNLSTFGKTIVHPVQTYIKKSMQKASNVQIISSSV